MYWFYKDKGLALKCKLLYLSNSFDQITDNWFIVFPNLCIRIYRFDRYGGLNRILYELHYSTCFSKPLLGSLLSVYFN